MGTEIPLRERLAHAASATYKLVKNKIVDDNFGRGLVLKVVHGRRRNTSSYLQDIDGRLHRNQNSTDSKVNVAFPAQSFGWDT